MCNVKINQNKNPDPIPTGQNHFDDSSSNIRNLVGRRIFLTAVNFPHSGHVVCFPVEMRLYSYLIFLGYTTLT